MTSREIIRAIIKDKDCPERMGLYESFWPDLRPAWELQGLPDTGTMADAFDLDIHGINDEWTSTDAFVGGKRVVEEDDTTYVEENGWGARMRYWKGKSGTPEHVSFALTSEQRWRRDYRERFMALDARRLGDVGQLREKYRRLTAAGRFRVYEVLFVVEIMRRAMGDIGMLEAMCLNPAWIRDFCTVLTDNIILHLEYELKEVGLPDGVWFYDDLAYSKLPFMSPVMYRELVLPNHRRFVEFCHSHGLPVILHTCGNIQPLFPDILDSGIDCLQPLEAKTGQNVVTMAKSAPRRIAYVGNLDVRAFETNDPAQVEAEVLPKLRSIREERIPYVFQSDHSIPGSVTLTTYRYALELFRRHGHYREAQ